MYPPFALCRDPGRIMVKSVVKTSLCISFSILPNRLGYVAFCSKITGAPSLPELSTATFTWYFPEDHLPVERVRERGLLLLLGILARLREEQGQVVQDIVGH